MYTQSFEETLQHTARQLSSATDEMRLLLERTGSERVRLLAAAFSGQLAELLTTVQRIISKQSARVKQRSIVLDVPIEYVRLSQTVDSQSLTFWLLEMLRQQQELYSALVNRGRLGGARSAVVELAALFTAQRKRIALEAHRFSDL